MQTYSFRAEVPVDVVAFKALLNREGVVSDLNVVGGGELPDVKADMRADAPLERLQELMRQVDDGHVMLQTLRPVPLADNSLVRDFEII
jgi:hypothetical protein